MEVLLHDLFRSIQSLVPQAKLAPLLYTLEFQIKFLHSALVFHFPRVQLVLDVYFQTANLGKMIQGHDQHDHGKHCKRYQER